jgi:hypothetical protein
MILVGQSVLHGHAGIFRELLDAFFCEDNAAGAARNGIVVSYMP